METSTRELTVGEELYMTFVAGAGALLTACITAFFALRRTVVEQTSSQAQTYFESLSERVKHLEAALETERDQSDELRTQRDALDAQNRLLREQVEATDAQNRLLTVANADLTEQIGKLERQVQMLENELHDERRTNAVLLERLNALERRMNEVSEPYVAD